VTSTSAPAEGTEPKAEGGQILRSVPVSLPGDGNCCPSGGANIARYRSVLGVFVRASERHSDDEDPQGFYEEEAEAQPTAVDCPKAPRQYVEGHVNSARGLTCQAAQSDLKNFSGARGSAFATPNGFDCVRLSGSRLGGEWRCTDGPQAFRFTYGD